MTLLIGPIAYADTEFQKANGKIVLEEYQTIENIDELFNIAKADVALPDNQRVKGKINGKEVPVYTATEKVKKLLDTKTGEESYIYRVTTFTYDTFKNLKQNPASTNGTYSIQSLDTQDRSWPTTRIILRAYYEGRVQNDDGIYFYRISKWDAWWDQLDYQAWYTYQKFKLEARSEATDGTPVDDNSTYNINMPTQEKWYTLTPWWGNYYLAATEIDGQRGRVEIKVNRGTNSWILENENNYGYGDRIW